MLEVRLFRRIECDINHCLVVAKIKKKLLSSTRETQKSGMDRLNLKRINEVEIREKY
jgi:hypothetical protein